ncbi:MAG: hypothetical protein ACLFP1_09430 [Candidatus Goldiibacteriota bacterium]
MYKIVYEQNNDILYAKPHGEQTLENNKQLAVDVVKKIKKLKLRKLLLDSHGFIGQPGTFQDYDLAEFISPLVANEIDKIAFFHPIETAEFSRFFETAARNKGVNVKEFTDRNEAEKWLISDIPD